MTSINQRKYNKTYYQKHPEKRAQFNLEARQRNRLKVLEYLETHPCVDCSEKDVRLMEFDHVRGKKAGTISVMVNRPCGWVTIKAEIDKCEVRCVKCHRLKTAREQGWYRDKPVSLSNISTPATLP
jgi:ribulose bisphosphate carboxylase small subunit